MAMVIDPICGMRIEADDAAATAEHDGQTYYFCSEACRDVFVSDPAGYGGDPGAMDADRLGEEEVAERAGISADRLRQLVDLGLLAPADGAFRRRDVMRARVVGQLESKGLDLQALASAHASGHLTLGYLESAGRRHPRLGQTFAEFSERIGIPVDTVQSLYMAFGLPRPRQDEYVREDDEPILRALPVLFGAVKASGKRVCPPLAARLFVLIPSIRVVSLSGSRTVSLSAGHFDSFGDGAAQPAALIAAYSVLDWPAITVLPPSPSFLVVSTPVSRSKSLVSVTAR